MPNPDDTRRRLGSMERYSLGDVKPAKAFDPSAEQLNRIEDKLDALTRAVDQLMRERRIAEVEPRFTPARIVTRQRDGRQGILVNPGE